MPEEKEIFQLLKLKGPLCVSQLSVELLEGPKEITQTLRKMEEKRVVEKRPDRDKGRKYSPPEIPWGLVTLG